MRGRKIFDALTGVREEYIEEARTTKLKKQSAHWRKWTAIAACAVVAIGLGGILLIQNFFPFGGSMGNSRAGHDESSIFMSYAGPVFPLTSKEENNAITAVRNIGYDFSLTSEDGVRIQGAGVKDSYTLVNSSEEEKTIKAIYPFAGSFNDLQEQMPSIIVNGKEVSPALYAGGYSRGFTSDLRLNSWEGYKALLEDGSYENNAFAPYPDLSQQVTVYTFTDFEAPEDYNAATQAIFFTVDPDRTNILQYGFNGEGFGDDGFRRYSYFVPHKANRRSDRKLLIVIGDDITDYTLQGYKNGACENGNELDGVSATVTRERRVLADVMGGLINDFLDQYSDGNSHTIPREAFLGAVSEFMVQYNLVSESVPERCQCGILDEVMLEAKNLQRVFYLEFEVTMPAGRSVSITVDMHKKWSYDFTCSGSDNEGIQGYDFVTQLGSNLIYDVLTAELTHTDNIEIVRQNCGFNLLEGITKVELDPAAEHYYLEIRSVSDGKK